MPRVLISMLLLVLGGVALGQTPGSLPESPDSTIGYPGVQAALDALHKKPGVTFKSESGWTIATDEAAFAVWSFAPKEHPAYPAVVKRAVVTRNGATYVDMSAQCGRLTIVSEVDGYVDHEPE